MKFHLTITNNETGEIIKDLHANAIIAGVHIEGGTNTIVVTDCGPVGLVAAIHATKKGLAHITDNDPVIAALVALTGDKMLKDEVIEADIRETIKKEDEE